MRYSPRPEAASACRNRSGISRRVNPSTFALLASSDAARCFLPACLALFAGLASASASSPDTVAELFSPVVALSEFSPLVCFFTSSVVLVAGCTVGIVEGAPAVDGTDCVLGFVEFCAGAWLLLLSAVVAAFVSVGAGFAVSAALFVAGSTGGCDADPESVCDFSWCSADRTFWTVG